MNPFGVRGDNPFNSPFGLRPPRAVVPAQIPPPVIPAPLAPVYRPLGTVPTMARRLAPGMEMLANMGRRVSTVVPLPFVQRASGILDEAAKDTKQMGGPVTVQQLTDWIRRRESGGNYQALNNEKRGNTASGAYQYTDATWNGYGGYSKAMLAPKAVQDRRFQEDVAARWAKYNGDPFKAIAEHYLPAFASNPATWKEPIRLKNGTVRPVAEYVRYIIKGTPLEDQFDEYLAAH